MHLTIGQDRLHRHPGLELLSARQGSSLCVLDPTVATLQHPAGVHGLQLRMSGLQPVLLQQSPALASLAQSLGVAQEFSLGLFRG
jgi:hypothetical protein